VQRAAVHNWNHIVVSDLAGDAQLLRHRDRVFGAPLIQPRAILRGLSQLTPLSRLRRIMMSCVPQSPRVFLRASAKATAVPRALIAMAGTR